MTRQTVARTMGRDKTAAEILDGILARARSRGVLVTAHRHLVRSCLAMLPPDDARHQAAAQWLPGGAMVPTRPRQESAGPTAAKAECRALAESIRRRPPARARAAAPIPGGVL